MSNEETLMELLLAYELANTVFDCITSPIQGPTISKELQDAVSAIDKLDIEYQLAVYSYLDKKYDEYYKPNEDGISAADMSHYMCYN
jgi:hypothetical protein